MEKPLDLGEYYPCLNVQDLEASVSFYKKLGFRLTNDQRADKWAVMQHNNMVLCLYQGHIERNMINFRGGEISEIAKKLEGNGLPLSKPAHEEEDGSWSAEVVDPDGNVIYFNTYPEERQEYMEKGKLIDY